MTAELQTIPYLGPILSALAVALIQTPHRLRRERQLWAYSGLSFGNPHQCGILLGRRSSLAFEETAFHAGPEQRPQP